MTRVIQGDQIAEIVPHRYENLLIDRVVLEGESMGVMGTLYTEIDCPDRLGRDIFTKQKTPTQRVVLPCIFMEILAIGSIVSSDRVKPGQIVFFAGISQFQKFGDFEVGVCVAGSVEKRKDKGGFLLCEGKLFVEKTPLASGLMLAYFADGAETQGAKKLAAHAITETCHIPLVKDPGLKHLSMFVVDALVDHQPDSQVAVCKYRFPQDHPLIKGHFPNRPVMMGVMQWMMVEDAVLVLAQQWQRQGLFRVSGMADLIKSDGTSVCEIRGFEVLVYWDVLGYTNQVDMIKTEKISFRDVVLPGEVVYIRLSELELYPA